MTDEPQTKQQQILDPHSDWNQAANDEPVFVIRAVNWKAAILVASLVKDDNGSSIALFESALAMREYHIDNDIPF